MPRPFINLYDILPDVEVDFNRFYTSEQEVIAPALRARNYLLTGDWYSSERDSFGPLSRAIHAVNPEGERITIFYG